MAFCAKRYHIRLVRKIDGQVLIDTIEADALGSMAAAAWRALDHHDLLDAQVDQTELEVHEVAGDADTHRVSAGTRSAPAVETTHRQAAATNAAIVALATYEATRCPRCHELQCLCSTLSLTATRRTHGMSDTMETTERRSTGTMAEMNDSGDTKVMWDKDNPDEVVNARETFNRLTKDRKFAAFTVKKNGEQGERILAFDPEAERIILVPQLRGG